MSLARQANGGAVNENAAGLTDPYVRIAQHERQISTVESAKTPAAEWSRLNVREFLD